MSDNLMVGTIDESEALVKLGKTTVPLRDVPLGREFVRDGIVYQATATPTIYGKVPIGSYFRHGDDWLYRRNANEYEANQVYPNMPFGKPSLLQIKRIKPTDRVHIRNVEKRGPAPA